MTDQEELELLKRITDTITERVAEANAATTHKFMSEVAEAILKRMEQIAIAQVNLAGLLRNNRRDARATEFAKQMLAQKALLNKGKFSEELLLEIGHSAYMLANQMEEFAMVAELQARSAHKQTEQFVQEQIATAPANASLESMMLALRDRQRGKT